MYVAYLSTTILAALACGFAACLNFAGADYVAAVADRVRVDRRWMVPLGVLLACGAVGLVAGLAATALGLAAATGLVVYFIGALGAHLRVGDRQFGGAVFFLVLALSAFATNVGYHHG